MRNIFFRSKTIQFIQLALWAGLFLMASVTNAADLGVGVASPNYNFDLSSSGVWISSMHFSLNGNNVGGWITSVLDNNFFLSSGAYFDMAQGGWVQATTDGVAIIAGSQNWGYQIYTASGTPVGQVANIKQRFLIAPNGNVGIGPNFTTPGYLIQLSANGTTGGAYSDGNTWYNSSSRTLKENINDLSSDVALKTLDGLTPVTFNYRTDAEGKHVGFIAEDVPDLVATKDRKGLSPMDIVAVLTKVVQEQRKTMDEQRRTMDTMQKKIDMLEKQLGTRW